jgi:hypothetical protein
MAGTIAVDVNVQAENGVWSLPFSRSFSIVQTAPGSHDALHYLTQTEEAIDLGELSTGAAHFAVLFNVGDITIAYGPDDGLGAMVPFGEIAAGECAVVTLSNGVGLMAASVGDDGGVLWPVIFES